MIDLQAPFTTLNPKTIADGSRAADYESKHVGRILANGERSRLVRCLDDLLDTFVVSTMTNRLLGEMILEARSDGHGPSTAGLPSKHEVSLLLMTLLSSFGASVS